MKTRGGVYKDLSKSDYKLSNGDITLFFSSELYRDNFLYQYKMNREKQNKRMDRVAYHTHIDFDNFHDIHFYKYIEKRGFYVEGWMGELSFEHLEQRYLTHSKNTVEWTIN